MSKAIYNWALAFTDYCKGVSYQDISEAHGIPLTVLKSRSEKESWFHIRETMGAPETNVGKTVIEKDLNRIRANRQRNLMIATSLQDHLLETIESLREGTLTFEVQTKMGVVTRKANLDDLNRIASTAETVARMTYRALSDVEEKPKVDQLPPGAAVGGGQIMIMLPGSIASPREERALNEKRRQELEERTPVGEVLQRIPKGPTLDAEITNETINP